MKALTVLLTLLAAFAVAAPGAAADPKAPAGAVVLTVAGNIGFSNRPAFDPARDSFFKFHERTFERAVQFDRAMLESLGTRQATIDFPGVRARPARPAVAGVRSARRRPSDGR